MTTLLFLGDSAALRTWMRQFHSPTGTSLVDAVQPVQVEDEMFAVAIPPGEWRNTRRIAAVVTSDEATAIATPPSA